VPGYPRIQNSSFDAVIDLDIAAEARFPWAAFHERNLQDSQIAGVMAEQGLKKVTVLRVADNPLSIQTGMLIAEGLQITGRGVGRRELVDVCPAGFLLADDFGNARIDFPGEGEEIFGFHVPHLHGVAAGQEFDALIG
jgi:hypothetical protein